MKYPKIRSSIEKHFAKNGHQDSIASNGDQGNIPYWRRKLNICFIHLEMGYSELLKS